MVEMTDGFVDIHTHILPDVDDGPKDVLEAIELARMAWEDGTRVLFLTPHYRGAYKKNTPAWLRECLSLFRQMLQQSLPQMRLYLGNEAHYETQLPQLLESGRVLPLGDSHYVLLEFPYNALRSQILEGTSETLRSGFTPVIAHAERYDIFRRDAGLVDVVTDMGALIQLNAQSVMGDQGYAVKRYCHRLLKQRKVHFIASDAHDVKRRPPLLQKCWRHVCSKYSQEYADTLFRDNAQNILVDL